MSFVSVFVERRMKHCNEDGGNASDGGVMECYALGISVRLMIGPYRMGLKTKLIRISVAKAGLIRIKNMFEVPGKHTAHCCPAAGHHPRQSQKQGDFINRSKSSQRVI